jgi:hypothetical protein
VGNAEAGGPRSAAEGNGGRHGCPCGGVGGLSERHVRCMLGAIVYRRGSGSLHAVTGSMESASCPGSIAVSVIGAHFDAPGQSQEHSHVGLENTQPW